MGKPDPGLRKEIRALIRSGRIYRGRIFHVRVGPSTLSRTLISIRRQFGSAVARNRVRRQIRHLCRQSLLLEPPGRLILISISDGASGASYQEYRAELAKASHSLVLDTHEVLGTDG